MSPPIGDKRSFTITKCSLLDIAQTIRRLYYGRYQAKEPSEAAERAAVRIMNDYTEQQRSQLSSTTGISDADGSTYDIDRTDLDHPAEVTDNAAAVQPGAASEAAAGKGEGTAEHDSMQSDAAEAPVNLHPHASSTACRAPPAVGVPVTFDFELTETTHKCEKRIYTYHASITKHVPPAVLTLAPLFPKARLYDIVVTGGSSRNWTHEQASGSSAPEKVRQAVVMKLPHNHVNFTYIPYSFMAPALSTRL